jgi:hypothetical protein
MASTCKDCPIKLWNASSLGPLLLNTTGYPQPKGVFLTKKMGLVEVVPMVEVVSILVEKY